jgi:peptidoglycan/LPS O-acetylase OafA/YrhL
VIARAVLRRWFRSQGRPLRTAPGDERQDRRPALHAGGFMPQLDGLRAFAVAAVMIHHLLDIQATSQSLYSQSWGLLGVRLFFVLSGFLITGLLLEGRDAVEAGTAQRAGVLQRFYIRRTLRIFPLYYLVLGIALVFGGDDVRAQLPSLATYTYNFWIAGLGWFPAHFSHFWSLCVEEQFYLLWPWIILFAPRRYIAAMAIVMVLLAPLYRTVAWFLEFNIVASFVLTPSSFDALGMGALLAIAAQKNGSDLERRLRLTALPIGLAGMALLATDNMGSAIFGETMVALVFTWLVAGAAHGFGGVGRSVLEAAPIRYLGRISYGLYVYHLLVPGVFGPLLGTLGLRLAPKGVVEFLLYSLITIGVASLSWAWIEHPINRLKRRFAEVR